MTTRINDATLISDMNIDQLHLLKSQVEERIQEKEEVAATPMYLRSQTRNIDIAIGLINVHGISFSSLNQMKIRRLSVAFVRQGINTVPCLITEDYKLVNNRKSKLIYMASLVAAKIYPGHRTIRVNFINEYSATEHTLLGL